MHLKWKCGTSGKGCVTKSLTLVHLKPPRLYGQEKRFIGLENPFNINSQFHLIVIIIIMLWTECFAKSEELF